MALIDPAPIDIRRQKDTDNPVSFLAGGTLCVLRLINDNTQFEARRWHVLQLVKNNISPIRFDSSAHVSPAVRCISQLTVSIGCT